MHDQPDESKYMQQKDFRPIDPALRQVADWLACFEPRPPRIDRDWLMFQAGQAWAQANRLELAGASLASQEPAGTRCNAKSQVLLQPALRIRDLRSWFWPAVAGGWMAVAMVLAVLLARPATRPAPTVAVLHPPSQSPEHAVKAVSDYTQGTYVTDSTGNGPTVSPEASRRAGLDQAATSAADPFEIPFVVRWLLSPQLVEEAALPAWLGLRNRLATQGVEAWDLELRYQPGDALATLPGGRPADGDPLFPESDRPRLVPGSVFREGDWLAELGLRPRRVGAADEPGRWWSLFWIGTKPTRGGSL